VAELRLASSMSGGYTPLIKETWGLNKYPDVQFDAVNFPLPQRSSEVL
jgi:hypothetical protein